MLNSRSSRTLFFALIMLSARARADAESVSLDYRAPDECPNRESFEREVRARTAKVKFASEGRHFELTLEKGEAGWVGVLAIREAGAPASERRFEGAACDEVVSALALVTALAIDPEASTAPRSELSLPESEPTPKPEPERKTLGAEPKPTFRARVVPAVHRQNEIEPNGNPLHARAGLNLMMVSGPASELLFAAGPALELARPTSLGESSLRVGVLAAETGVVGASAEQARFRWLVGRIALCPLGSAAPAYYRLCAASDVGVLSARGTDVAVPDTRTRAWLSAGSMGVVGYQLGPRFYVEASGGALANLTRDRFRFDAPPRPIAVWDVPFASFFAGLGAGVEIP